MNNNEQAIIKLAQIRMAINHVLRIRNMQKQAGTANMNPANMPRWAGGYESSHGIMRFNKNPENVNWGSWQNAWALPLFFPRLLNQMKETNNKTQRMTDARTNNTETSK